MERVWGEGFGVQGVGFRVQGPGCRGSTSPEHTKLIERPSALAASMLLPDTCFVDFTKCKLL
jgi:hypothetical protein